MLIFNNIVLTHPEKFFPVYSKDDIFGSLFISPAKGITDGLQRTVFQFAFNGTISRITRKYERNKKNSRRTINVMNREPPYLSKYPFLLYNSFKVIGMDFVEASIYFYICVSIYVYVYVYISPILFILYIE